MPIERFRSFFVLLLAGLILAGLAGCFPGINRVEPYPERKAPPDAAGKAQSSTVQTGRVGRQIQRKVTAGATGQPQTGGQGTTPVAVLPVLTRVDDRVAAYEEKLRAWERVGPEAGKLAQDPELGQKVADCQGRLQGILGRYNQLHDLLIKKGAGLSPGDATMGLLQDITAEDIGFLEGECQQLLAGGQQAGSGAGAGIAPQVLAEKEQAIAAAMTANDYAQVIALYGQLPVADGHKPSLATGESYGQALLRTGREQEAGKVFASLLQDIQQQNQVGREFQLMQLIADIQFGQQDYTSAFNGYVDIINKYAGLGENIDWARKQQAVINARNQQGEEVKSFAALMRAHLGFNQARDGFKVVLLAERFLASFPESAETPTVNRFLFEARDSAEKWYAGNLQQIIQLKEEKKFAAGLKLLQGLPRQELPLDKQTQLQALADEMTAVQTREAEVQRSTEEAGLQETWNKGQNHLQLKEYDQAIAVFSGMMNTSYAGQAKGMISEAANLAAQEDRQKAAELFVQAGGAKDQAAKIALLKQSRQLLQDILNKYPQSDLVGKVRKNLEKIEQDLRAIDPSLLTAPASGPVPANNGQPAAPAQNGSAMPVSGQPVTTAVPPAAGEGGNRP